MTVTLCILFMAALFTAAVVISREVFPAFPVSIHQSLHVLSLLLILLAIGTGGIWYDAQTYLGDLWTAYEALHKTAQGLRSSVDYFNPIGPLMQWIYGLTLLIHSPSAYSIVLANVAVALLSLALTVALLRGRATPLTIAVTGLIAVTTALTARDIDSLISASESSMLAPYNRWGWALLLPVAMRLALPVRNLSIPGGVLAGVALSLLLLLKVTYGLAAVGIWLVALVIQPSKWREFAIVAVSACIAIIAANVVTDGQVGAYFHDLSLTAQMPANGVRIAKFITAVPVFLAFTLGCLILLLASGEAGKTAAMAVLNRHWRAALLALAVGGSGLVVLMQNHYYTEASTLLLMPLIVVEWTRLASTRGAVRETAVSGHRLWLGVVLLVTLALPTVDAGFILSQAVQTGRKTAPAAFAGTQFHDLVIDETHLPGSNGECQDSTCDDMARMLSGRDLLSDQCPSYGSTPILAFNFSNPFPAITGSPSPRSSPIWLHKDRSFSHTLHEPAAKLLSDVGCVLVAKNESNAASLMAIYARNLRRSFAHAGENEHWQLWIRKQGT